EKRRSLLLDRLKAENQVFRRYGRAIVKTRFGAEIEDGEGEIFRHLDACGNEPVFSAWIVIGLAEKRFKGKAEPVGGLPAGNKGIEVIEAAFCRETQGAAFRRIGVHIVKMREIRAVFQRAGQRQSMAFDGFDPVSGIGSGKREAE